MEQILQQKGWENMGKQKQQTMMSFIKGNIRMNIYMTTRTVTFQDVNKKFDKGHTYRNVKDILDVIKEYENANPL